MPCLGLMSTGVPVTPLSLCLCQAADSTTDKAEEVKSYSRYKYSRMVKKQGGLVKPS